MRGLIMYKAAEKSTEILRKAGLPHYILTALYRGTNLQSTVRTRGNIIRVLTYYTGYIPRALSQKIMADLSHPSHKLLVPLLSSRRYQTVQVKSLWFRSSFFPQAVRILSNKLPAAPLHSTEWTQPHDTLVTLNIIHFMSSHYNKGISITYHTWHCTFISITRGCLCC